MKKLVSFRTALTLGGAVLLMVLFTGRVEPQDPSLDPNYGSVKLKAGFLSDPYTKQVTAGGNLKTNKGDLTAWISKAPDFKLTYEAGAFPLTIHVDSKADTTLLINLPDGTWIADDDSGGNLNPLLKFAKPQSGRYDIWVGTIGKENASAKLIITELK